MVFFDIIQNYYISSKIFTLFLIILYIKQLIEGLIEFLGPKRNKLFSFFA